MTGIVLPGGWHYEENGKMIIDDAVSYEDLIDRLSRYRAFSGLPLGDPQTDIDAYVCRTYPVMCGGRPPAAEEGVDPVELSYGVPVVKSPRERVMQWVVNRIERSGQIEFVDRETAEYRARICAECPKVTRWNEPIDGCPGCQVYVEEAETKLVKLRANKQLHDMQISGHCCTVAGHDLETAVWLEAPALKHRKNYVDKFPSRCWLKDLRDE